MNRRPHLLYVAWGFPPSRGAGVYRALATANAYAAAGWKVTVLTASREVFEYQTGTDPELEAMVDPDIRVVRAPFSWIRGEPDLSKWSRARVESNLMWNYLRTKADAIQFPEPVYGGWKRELLAATRRIQQETPVDLVIGSANPNVDFAPGFYLHERYGIPYVMDYRDSWHLDLYADRHISNRWSRSVRLERRMLAKAAEAWFVNQPILDWQAAEYPESAHKFSVVANAFDAAFATPFADLSPSGTDQTGLTFGYLGTMYGPIPIRETLEGWRRARQSSPLLARSRLVVHGRLGHYADPNPDLLSLFKKFKQDGVSYQGPVSKTSVGSVYSTFDVLVLTLSPSRYITSGKVFEYAATGLPIVSIHQPTNAASDILREHNDWFPAASLEPSDVSRALIQAGERAVGMTLEDCRRNRQWAGKLSREQQLAPRIEALTRLVEDRSAYTEVMS